MKTPRDWVEGLEYVERQEHPSDQAAAWEKFIEKIQQDAAQATAEAILERIAAHGIDVSDCDGDDDVATIVGDWAAGRIQGLMEGADEAEQTVQDLRERLNRLQDSF